MLYPSFSLKSLGPGLGLAKMSNREAKTTRELFFKVFKENNRDMRRRFFGQPMI
jgi:hypothetical protein